MLHAHIRWLLYPQFLPILEAEPAQGIHLSAGPDIPNPADLEILIDDAPTLADFQACPKLRAVIIPYAGVPPETLALARQFPQVRLYNIHHNSEATAEMAIALLLAVAKNICIADKRFRTGDWTPRYAPLPALELHGKTALILGYGAVGQRVAAMCRGLGMFVMGVRRRYLDTPTPDDLYLLKDLPKLWPQADAVFVCLPLTDDTRHLIDARALAALPPHAVLINVGRAEVVEEKALYEALVSRQIFGAGFDVWYNYPPSPAAQTHTFPATYPFHELENIIMSPHRAGGLGTEFVETRRMKDIARSLNLAARGEPIPNPIDITAGY